MRVLLIGSGGREHALAAALIEDPQLEALHVAPGNPGIAQIAICHQIDTDNNEAVVTLAAQLDIDLVVIGPEKPLVNGLADALVKAKIACFGPSQAAAQLEGSKDFAKQVMRDAGVPTADFMLIESEADIAKVALPFPLFLKPVAEGSGKGVNARSKVETAAELRAVAQDLLQQFSQPVLVEAFLPGREFTVGITGTGADACVLGVLEIVPGENYIGHGYGLENKEGWENRLTVVRAQGGIAMQAGEVALAAWRVLRCRDGGRADVRLDAAGQPRFIEVNPLAGIRPGYSDLCFIADFEGLDYQGLIGKFIASFLARHPGLP